MRKRKLFKILIFFCFIVTLFTACAKMQNVKPKEKNSRPIEPYSKVISEYPYLTLYTALSENEVPAYFNAFQKDTGIKIIYECVSTGEMLNRIKSERKERKATVILGSSSDTYISAAQQGLLQKYKSQELWRVPDRYKDAEGYWNPCYLGAICFACDTTWFEENGVKYPKKWDDLTSEVFENQIVMAHPSSSGTSYTILAGLVQMKGEEKAFEYLKKLHENVKQYEKSGVIPSVKIGLGEAAVAVSFAHDSLKVINEGLPVKIVFPSDGTSYEVGGVAILNNAIPEEIENAKLFIDWLISKRGQECFIEAKSNRLPVNMDARVTEGLIPIDDLSIIEYDPIWSGENRDRLIDKFNNQIYAFEE